jgi:hypothetical protein
MVQFIGGETRYGDVFNLYSSLKEVFNTDGISGFFSGLMPRLIGEISTYVVAGFAVHRVQHFFQDPNVLTFAPYICNVSRVHFLGSLVLDKEYFTNFERARN